MTVHVRPTAVLVAGLALIACETKPGPDALPTASAPGAIPHAPETPYSPKDEVQPTISVELDDDQKKAAQPVLSGYEALRNALAEDKLDAVAGLASKLSAAAKDADLPKDLAPRLEQLSEASDKLATVKGEPDDVRRAYGDVSRQFIGLLLEAPSLQEGLFLFKCPMAQEYPKWVQTTEKMANPYMGQKMLECGSSTKWRL